MNSTRFSYIAELVGLAEEHRKDVFISLIIGVFLEAVWFNTTINTFLELDLSNSIQVFVLALIVIVHVGLVPLIFLCGILLLLSFIRRKESQKIPKEQEKPSMKTLSRPAIAGESEQRTCPECGGRGNNPCPNLECEEGYIRYFPFKFENGKMINKEKCPKCRGSNILLCKMCNATGKVTT
jgi:hypothetical protein